MLYVNLFISKAKKIQSHIPCLANKADSDSKVLFFFLVQDFKVLTLLGKGSFACVYRAKSMKTGLDVAIKTVQKKKIF